MCVYMCEGVYACVKVCMHVCVRARVFLCVRARKRMCVHVYMCVTERVKEIDRICV